jgi:hypothetical protein
MTSLVQTPLLSVSVQALLYSIDELRAHRISNDDAKAVNRFAAATKNLGAPLLNGYPVRSADERKRVERLADAWRRLPLYLQHRLVGWARKPNATRA